MYKNELSDLSEAIRPITTEKVMETLPPEWCSLDSESKRCAWVLAREKESICLAAYLKESRSIIGIVLLTKPEENINNSIEFRLGYFIAEMFWGQGYASEIINGLCDFCEKQEEVKTITAGVSPTNPGSIKVLTKNGFQLDEEESGNEMQFYKYLIKHDK